MPAAITVFQSRSERLRRDHCEAVLGRLSEVADLFPDSLAVGRLVDDLIGQVHRRSASSNKWTFIMLSPDQNFAVNDHLRRHSKMPTLAGALWSLCFRYVRPDTGEILQSREELAATLETSPRNVSRIMSELVEFGAISRRRSSAEGVNGPGFVRYFMNPTVGTHLSGKARDDAQAAAPILKLIDGSAHPSQRRERAAVPSLVPLL